MLQSRICCIFNVFFEKKNKKILWLKKRYVKKKTQTKHNYNDIDLYTGRGYLSSFGRRPICFVWGDGLQEVPFPNTYQCPEPAWLAEHWLLPRGPAAGQFLPVSSLYLILVPSEVSCVASGGRVLVSAEGECASSGRRETVRLGNSGK